MTTLVPGRVVDEHGCPLAGVTVLVDGPVPLPDIAQLTGTDGTFTVVAPAPGRYRLGLRAPGRAPEDREFDVDEVPPEVLEIVMAGPA
jgi:hypothetical protein